MTWLQILTVLALGLAATARRFDNPVLLGDFPDPGALKVGDRYYVVTTTNNDHPEKFPITTSTDLQNWTIIGYVFNATNLPPWSDKDHEYWAPEMHQVGNSYRVYFVARHREPNQVGVNELYIGVATAPQPQGPWSSLEQPIWRDPQGGAIDPNLMNDNGTLYLSWKGKEGFIWARRLNSDGLSFAKNSQEIPLFKDTLPWEAGQVEGPFYVRRGNYHYIFYSGEGTCSDNYAIGVARSLNVLGPYEKHGDPVLKKTNLLLGPGHNSVVRDVDGVSDVMIYHARKNPATCDDGGRPMCVSSMGWTQDGWPYIFDNEK